MPTVFACRHFVCVVSCEQLLALHTLYSNHDALRGLSLTQQAKILSFDKAKRAQRDRSRLSVSSRSTARDARYSSADRSAHNRSGAYDSTRSRRDADYAARAAERLRYADDDAFDVRTYSRDVRRSSSTRDFSEGRARSSHFEDDYATRRLAWDDSAEDAEAEQSACAEEPASRIERMKRKLAKDKADRKFARQYGGSDRATAPGEGGPRAAVYKGEMGSTHRRSSRMQNEGSSSRSRTSRAGGEPSSRVSRVVTRPWFIAVAATAFCLVFTASFLYPSAAQLYHSVRERDQLQAEYAAIEQRNDSIQTTVDALSTDAGVEDRAHQEFGWVSKGENAVTVYGLDLDDESTFTASIVPGSVPAPETWYSKLFGPIFGEK